MKSKPTRLLIGALYVSLLLAGGCNKSKEEELPVQKEEMLPAQEESYTLSTYLEQEGPSIWYKVSNDDIVGKDTPVDYVYVFDGDQVMFADLDMTLGELSHLTNEEIIPLVQKAHATPDEDRITELEEYIKSAVFSNERLEGILSERLSYYIQQQFSREDLISSIEEEISFYQEELQELWKETLKEPFMSFADSCLNDATNSEGSSYDKIHELVEEAIANSTNATWLSYQQEIERIHSEGIEASPYEMYITSDATGNMTESESIRILKKSVPVQIDWQELSGHIEFDELISTIELSYGTYGDIIVYDSCYGGYGNNSSYFITKCTEGTIFELDDVSSTELPVDPSTFQLNQKILEEQPAGVR